MPSLRSLAAEAGVSPMTVSLALRNHPRISMATRERIQQLATLQGYTPDPQIATLMHHLRTRRPKRLQAVIASVTTMTRQQTNLYSENIARAARERAVELGFGFDHIELPRYLDRPGSLNKVLRSRGIEGLVLLPMKEPITLDPLVDWRSMSVVATSHSVLSPHFHTILPDGFSSTLLMCGRLKELGFRRIGLVLSSDMEERSRHNITSAILWHNAYAGVEQVAPLIIPSGDTRRFADWLEQEQPDAIISENRDPGALLRWMGVGSGKKRPSFYFAGISLGAGDKAAGILQREEEIGRTAVELLAGMLQRGEKGIPGHPTLTLIPGVWKNPK